MITVIQSLGISGIEAYPVTIETFISSGLPGFDVVGLPDAAVRESRERVRAAMKSCGFGFPSGRITVNLAPADTKKEGAVYDLPIFLGLLASAEDGFKVPRDAVFVGELSLGGELRPMVGALPMALAVKEAGFGSLFLPLENASEAAHADGIEVYGARCVEEIIDHLRGVKQIAPSVAGIPAELESETLDFSDVKGQSAIKRALEVAAAGGHNILLEGPPGSGKSMLARRLPSILPEMSREEMFESTKIHSVAGLLSSRNPVLNSRPFRSPHHTVSVAGLTGGGGRNGALPQPGEFSLAHNGVLFMDEFPEFNRAALETLRQPLEDGVITLTRASGTVTYPARFMLVCAMNPCRCGWLGHPIRQCTCTEAQIAQYRSRLSGPILDRIDMRLTVPSLGYDDLVSRGGGEKSADIRSRVERARQIARDRMREYGVECNAQIPAPLVGEICKPDEGGAQLIRMAFNKGMTGRSYDRILRLARTIADLADSEKVLLTHVAEALQYRGENSAQ